MGRARNQSSPAHTRFDRLLGSGRGRGLARDWLDDDAWVLDGAFARQEADGRRLCARLSMPLPTHRGAMVIYLDGVARAWVGDGSAYVVDDTSAEVAVHDNAEAYARLRAALWARAAAHGGSGGRTRASDIAGYAQHVPHPPNAEKR